MPSMSNLFTAGPMRSRVQRSKQVFLALNILAWLTVVAKVCK